MPAESEQNASKIHGLVDFLWGLSCLFLVLIALVLISNWLDDFLHAPIGIKDNPPAPGAIVQVAHLSFWPIYMCWGILTCQRYTEIPPKKFFKWLAGLLAAAAIGWFLITSAVSLRSISFGKLMITAGTAYLVWLVVARWLDAKENRAIRAGSEGAFNKRVEYYVSKLDYSPEDALEATERIKNGKPNKVKAR